MDIEIVLEPSSGELRPLQNNADGSTRTNALEYDPDESTLINIRLETVQYGTYNGEPAVLVIFKFIIKFRPGFRRIRNFQVTIDLRRQLDSTAPKQPRIVSLAPEEARGKIFTEERTLTVASGVEVPLGLGTKAHISPEVERKISREYELKLSGWKKSSDIAEDNVLRWDCFEAKKASRGVVPGYRAAAIIENPGNDVFLATFELKAERGIFQLDKSLFQYLNVFGSKNVDDPVIFDPTQAIGKQYPNLVDFKDLDLNEYVVLDTIETLPSGYS